MSLLNRTINNLPFEAHIPGYSFCGPGTKLKERLLRGDVGKNPLDEACKQHDIAYSESNDLNMRHKADKVLSEQAWNRVKARNSSIGEKIAAWGVANAMKAKVKLGLGLKSTLKKEKKSNKKKCFKSIISKVAKIVKLTKPPTALDAIKVAIKSSKKLKNIIKPPRVIPVTHTGGVLPLIPIFAGLSALGALAGGASGVANAVNKARDASNQLDELRRHNKKMEAIAIGKGLYLAPYKKGNGLYLTHDKKKN